MNQQYRLTPESARAAGAYSLHKQLASLITMEGLDVEQVAVLPIPCRDRVWLIICAMGVPLDIIATYVASELQPVLRAALALESNPSWRMWAELWLTDIDRCSGSAARARQRVTTHMAWGGTRAAEALAFAYETKLSWQLEQALHWLALVTKANSYTNQLHRLVAYLQQELIRDGAAVASTVKRYSQNADTGDLEECVEGEYVESVDYEKLEVKCQEQAAEIARLKAALNKK